MKRTILFTLLSIISFNASAQGENDSLNAFFNKNVRNGLVDYQAIKNNQTEILNNLIKATNSALKTVDKKQLKANYINIYNLIVIKQIVDNFPISTPNEVPGFFDKNTFNINGEKTTLNNLEHKVIRPIFSDPRIHFALVCGAIGCPPIQKFSYKKKTIEQQLELVTTEAINNVNFIKISKDGLSAKVSEIFSWYAQDFGGNSKAVIEFINKYSTSQILKIGYYPYNWSLNIYSKKINNKFESNVQIYTPSALLKKGQIEMQIFNNLYSQVAFRDSEGVKKATPGRESWNTMQYTLNYGISKSGRFNLGLDLNLKSTSRANIESRAIEIFSFKQDAQNRTTISTIGPKIKWNPFKKIPKFSIQSTLLIPVSDSLENKKNRPWLDHYKYTWWTQLFYDQPIGSKYQLFAEIDFLLRTPTYSKDFDFYQSALSTPMSIFFSYFPTSKSTAYIQYQYSPVLTNFPDYFMHAGLGCKYQVFQSIQLELSCTKFFAGQNNGAGSTYNVGLRYIR